MLDIVFMMKNCARRISWPQVCGTTAYMPQSAALLFGTELCVIRQCTMDPTIYMPSLQESSHSYPQVNWPTDQKVIFLARCQFMPDYRSVHTASNSAYLKLCSILFSEKQLSINLSLLITFSYLNKFYFCAGFLYKNRVGNTCHFATGFFWSIFFSRINLDQKPTWDSSV